MIRTVTTTRPTPRVIPLDPKGLTVIPSPSGSGKTLLARDILVCLTGDDPSTMRPPALWGEPLDVTIETRTLRIRRRLTRSEGGELRQSRWITQGDAEPVSYSSETAFRSALASMRGLSAQYADPEVLRLVLSPASYPALPYWLRLASGEGNGRPLVTALLRTVDAATALSKIVRECPSYQTGDPTTEKDCGATLRDARKAADNADGATRQARAHLESLRPVVAPADDEVDRARATITSGEDWTAYRSHLSRVRALEDWRRKRDALGAEPSRVPEEEVNAAEEREVVAKRATGEAWARAEGGRELVRTGQTRMDALSDTGSAPEVLAWRKATGDVTRAADAVEDAERRKAEHQGAEPVQPPADCPRGGTCDVVAARHHQDVARWYQDGEQLEIRHNVALKAQREAVAAEETARGKLDKARAKAATTLEEATAAHVSAVQTLRERETEETTASESMAVVRNRIRARSDWQEKVAYLGPEPTDPGEMAQPTGAPPTDLDLSTARGILQASERAKGAASHAETARESARKAVEAREAEAIAKHAEVTRLEALQLAVRRAPGQLVAHAIVALGDTGPVTFAPREDGGIDVAIFGHPWQDASTGQVVYADACVRMAFRRALGVDWLPLIVDGRQDWSGEIPHQDGRPSIHLVTATP
jgi:hypothetical protein